MADINYALASLGAVATASSSIHGTTPGQAIDGSDVSFWRGLVSCTLYIDLGAAQYIESILWRNPPTGALYRALTVTIGYSNDGITYSAFDPLTNLPFEDTTFDTGGITARYWRFVVSSGLNNGAQAQEVQIIGPSDAPPPPANTNCAAMQAWLDGLESYWVPCVEAWLEAN